LELAKQAIEMASQSKDYQKRRNVLFERYARELKASGKDERLNPAKSIKYGLDYFSRMIELQKGDMSLALASYNAGPHRVKQYKGIPPYSETVGFRNRVLKYYKEYLDTLGEYRIKKKGKI
jgi:soluble lytic murein transglycosylase-like protein